jgi:hypothetical protein
MISEAQWKVIKHNDLARFNWPWLDLVIHVLINQLLPCVQLTLANILGTHCIGHPVLPNDWQNDFCAQWLDISKSDVDRWTCSYPSYLISWFLLFTHPILTENTWMTGFDPKDDLAFFASLQQNQFPPFYHIPVLHDLSQHSNSARVNWYKKSWELCRLLWMSQTWEG